MAFKGNGLPPSSLRAYHYDMAQFANNSAFVSEFNTSYVNPLAGSVSDFPRQFSSQEQVIKGIVQVAYN